MWGRNLWNQLHVPRHTRNAFLEGKKCLFADVHCAFDRVR